MRLAPVPPIEQMNACRLAFQSSGIVFAWTSLRTRLAIPCHRGQEASRSCSEASRRTIRSRASSVFLRCSKWTRPMLRQPAQTFACDGTIVRTAIYSLSIRPASGSPAWSPQTHPSITKIASPSNSHTLGGRDLRLRECGVNCHRQADQQIRLPRHKPPIREPLALLYIYHCHVYYVTASILFRVVPNEGSEARYRTRTAKRPLATSDIQLARQTGE